MHKSMSVHVKQGHVRKKPSFLGPVVARLAYGDKVVVLEDKNNWLDIKTETNGIRGFMHISALTTKTVILNPGDKEVKKAGFSDEYALAGKGFNENVENQFKKENPHLNFRGIDRMEGYKVSENQMKKFLSQGQLVPTGGVI